MKSWWKKGETSFGQKLRNFFSRSSKIDWEELESTLIQSDLGLPLAEDLINHLKVKKITTFEDAQEALSSIIKEKLSPFVKALTLQPNINLNVILVVGVNGSGKTTTISKIVHYFQNQGKKVAVVAADTFRAAAIEQLQIWGERLNFPVYARVSGSDAAALVYESFYKAQKENMDVLVIDTAGRLHNNNNLMEELCKIVRVIQKIDSEAPHQTILILDGTVGQNALSQVSLFKEKVGVDSIIMTKLDGTARGGILINIVDSYQIPIVGLSYGESIENFGMLNLESFTDNCVGREFQEIS